MTFFLFVRLLAFKKLDPEVLVNYGFAHAGSFKHIFHEFLQIYVCTGHDLFFFNLTFTRHQFNTYNPFFAQAVRQMIRHTVFAKQGKSIVS